MLELTVALKAGKYLLEDMVHPSLGWALDTCLRRGIEGPSTFSFLNCKIGSVKTAPRTSGDSVYGLQSPA